MRRALVVLAALIALSPALAGAAANPNMALCQNAAIAAADRHGVPREVMLAITLVETRTKRGGESGPWPWTVNVAGKGGWFDSRAAALIHAQKALAGGENSFDVGCFQLNYRWHGENFASIDQMFEPGPSSDYAARFVKDLHAETGDWIEASGLYHSRTPVHAKRYRTLVAKAVQRMGGDVPEPVEVVASAAPARAAAPVTNGASPGAQILRVGEPGSTWAERSFGQIRTPRGTSVSAGGVGLGLLRGASGGLIRNGATRAGG